MSDAIICESAEMQLLLRQAERVAQLNSAVLILGESGTGKELIAKFLHQRGPRAAAEFVAVNCGSVPEELLESEFFGHESGAYTGATERRAGLFEVAHGGTIFLDEIGNMPASLQMKLLRTLQESEIRRVGGTKTVKVDTRVISATNSQIDNEVKKGAFREDLYYRLSVVILEVPPLRDRPEDIAPLARHFIKRYGPEFDREGAVLTSDAVRLLERYHWPGNVRELENAVQRALVFSTGILDAAAFELKPIAEIDSEIKSLHQVSQEAAKEAEIKAILAVLTKTHGNKLKAAKLLGVSYKTLLNKVKEYALR